MLALKVISWNVRGLNSGIKRALVFKHLQSHRPNIVFLQETHLNGSKTMALHRAFIDKAFHSVYSNYARGVSVLVYRSLLYTAKLVKTDPFGRYVILILIINNRPHTFVAIYIPPPFTVKVWETIMSAVLGVAEGPIMLAGDLNVVLTPALDRYGMASMVSSPLRACTEPYDLVEAWRWKNPNTKAYSCYSATCNTLSRLDM